MYSRYQSSRDNNTLSPNQRPTPSPTTRTQSPSSTDKNTKKSPSSHDESKRTLQIDLIIVCCLLGLLLLMVAGYLKYRRRTRRSNHSPSKVLEVGPNNDPRDDDATLSPHAVAAEAPSFEAKAQRATSYLNL